MRGVAVGLLLCILALAASPAFASGPESGFVRGGEGAVDYGAKVPGGVPTTKAPKAAPTRTKAPAAVPMAPPPCASGLFYGDGKCVFLDDANVPTPQPVGLAAPAAPGIGGPQPEVIAAIEYFKTHRLPVPKPQMSAPEGITGAVHSIDLRIPPTEQYRDKSTPLGAIQLNATGRFAVDWGDGEADFYSTTGAPFPKSQLTHTYTDRGTYDIVVTANWSIQWNYAGQSGTVTGLTTTGTIPAFRVVELQAVVVQN